MNYKKMLLLVAVLALTMVMDFPEPAAMIL